MNINSLHIDPCDMIRFFSKEGTITRTIDIYIVAMQQQQQKKKTYSDVSLIPPGAVMSLLTLAGTGPGGKTIP